MIDMQTQEFLYNYVDVILKCERGIMENYDLDSIPYLNQGRIPKRNKFLLDGIDLEYNFHGSGCTFILGSVELDYCIYIDREDYIVVSPWGFTCFVNTFLKSDVIYTEAQIAEWLEGFNNLAIINKIYDEYLVYEISLTWYKAFKSGVQPL